MIEITESQRRVLETVTEFPVHLMDPQSSKEYVLIPVEIYERLRRVLVAEEIDPSFYELEEIEKPGS